MTRVEELRDKILWKERVPLIEEPEGEVHRTWRQATKKDLDELIAIAREEGILSERERIWQECVRRGSWGWLHEGEELIVAITIPDDVIIPSNGSKLDEIEGRKNEGR